MRLKTKLLTGVSALALITGLAACHPDAPDQNNTTVVENNTTVVTNVPDNEANDECPRADGTPCR